MLVNLGDLSPGSHGSQVNVPGVITAANQHAPYACPHYTIGDVYYEYYYKVCMYVVTEVLCILGVCTLSPCTPQLLLVVDIVVI